MQIEQKQNKIFKPQSIYTLAAEESNQVTTELENQIRAGGLTPSTSSLTQLRDSIQNVVNTAANELQEQIDAITVSSDVFDVVGTYADLQNYDTSTVPLNDIIKVLQDSTHNNAATYYRLVETSGGVEWQYVGQEGPFYTKSEADAYFALKSELPAIATNSQVGLVKPDGETVVVQNDGTLVINPFVSAALPLFTHLWTDHLLNDVSYLRANTFSWQSGNVYIAAYNELLSQYNNAGSTTEIDGFEPAVWELPVLSEAGTLGGNNYAVSTDVPQASTNFWNAFNADTAGDIFYSAQNNTVGSFTYYSPTPFCLKSMQFTNQTDSNSGNRASASGTIYGSNDGTNWVTLKTYTNTQQSIGGVWNIDLTSNSNAYKYYKLYSNGSNTNYWTFKKCILSGIYYLANITYKLTPKGYKIANADQESTIALHFANTGNGAYYILDTANTRFKLARERSREIVSQYQNGKIWYRLYADGWCEQGGTVSAEGVYYFMIPYADTNYTVVTSTQGVNADAVYGTNIKPANKSATGFCPFFGAASYGGAWKASGFSALDMSKLQGFKKYLYFYCGNFEQSAVEQTAGLNAELFNGKVDVDNMQEVRCVVEAYNNGSNWYRIYSDGWCEQGGKYYNNNTAVTFLKPFKDTNFSIMTQCTDTNPNDGAYQSVWTSKTTTGFIGWIIYGTSLGSNIETDWYAFGYIS